MLTPADEAHHIDKFAFTVPFVCGATDLGEALRRLGEGAAMIRSKGEAGTGNVVEAVRHMRSIRAGIRRLAEPGARGALRRRQGAARAVRAGRRGRREGKLPVVLFTAGGIATPADAALMMQLGAEGVFVGSGIFKSGDPARRARAIVEATTMFDDPDVLAKVSRGLGEAMVGHRDPDAAGRSALRRSGLVSSSANGEPRPQVGVLALQGDVREHLAALAIGGADAGAGAARRPSWRPRRDRDARRRVDHDRPAAGGLRAAGAAARGGRGRAAHVRLVRGHDPAGARDPGRP